MVNKQSNSLGIRKLFERFGINAEESAIYLQILEKGPQTVVELSRINKLSRTVIYRIVETLQLKGFVKEQISDNGRIFEASSPEILKMKLVEQELTVKSLEESLPEILEMLSMITKENISKSFIKYYRGIEGLKQISWNETKAKGEFRIYEINKMVSFLDEKFHSDVIDAFVKNKIIDYQLTNFTNYDEYTENAEFIKNYWQLRYVPQDEINIDFETIIYNDVYAMYEYKDDNIFGVEIYNAELSDMQKNIFDFVWKFARPMKIVNLKGVAKLE